VTLAVVRRVALLLPDRIASHRNRTPPVGVCDYAIMRRTRRESHDFIACDFFDGTMTYPRRAKRASHHRNVVASFFCGSALAGQFLRFVTVRR
jgi:hypothetical protein